MKLVLALIVVAAANASGPEEIGRRPRYWCPKNFIRAGNTCYYLSEKKATWKNAVFDCRDIKKSNLAVLDTYLEDKRLRRVLNRMKPGKHDRWIGGMYDWENRTWVWSPRLKPIKYQGFSRLRPRDNYKWRCAVMDPYLRYRWGTRSCFLEKQYICEKPIKIRYTTANKTRLKVDSKVVKINKSNHDVGRLKDQNTTI